MARRAAGLTPESNGRLRGRGLPPVPPRTSRPPVPQSSRTAAPAGAAAWLVCLAADELPAAVHRDLAAYAASLAVETGGETVTPEKLVGPMLSRFMASDRGFVRGRRGAKD